MDHDLGLVPVTPGRLRVRVVDRKTRLVLESGSAAAGVVHLRPSTGAAAGLRAATGSWEIAYVEPVPRHRKAHYAVTDGDGAPVATLEPAGSTTRLEVPGGSVAWRAPSLAKGRLFNYDVEGLLVARRSWTTLGKGGPGDRPFTVDVTPALVARPDAALVLLLATWLTWEHVSTPAA